MKDNGKLIRGMLAVSLAASTAAAAAAEWSITRYTIDGGGAVSIGGLFELSATIGQPDAGTASGGEFMLTGGFWIPQPPGDCNATGSADLLDYEGLAECLTGPADGGLEFSCRCYDMDFDGDVDLGDAAVFQTAFTGG